MRKTAAVILHLVLVAPLVLAQEESRRDADRIAGPEPTIQTKKALVEERKTAYRAKKVVDKKFVFGFLLPSVAATVVAAEGASCLHRDDPGGQILRHPPCGRSRAYPIYFGLYAVQVWSVHRLKKYDDEDRAAGRNPPKYSRWWAWGQVWTVAVGGMGVRNLARPVCPSGTTCTR